MYPTIYTIVMADTARVRSYHKLVGFRKALRYSATAAPSRYYMDKETAYKDCHAFNRNAGKLRIWFVTELACMDR